MTDQTGNGAIVFANSPTLINPIVGTQSPGDNSTKAASTAYADAVGAAISHLVPANNLSDLSNKTTAQINLGVREVLTGDRTYYVRSDGNDSNTGLANTSGGAFLTVNAGYNCIRDKIDFHGFNVTLQIGDGTYTDGGSTGVLFIDQAWVGGGTLTVQGNSGTPSNVVLSATGAAADCVRVVAPLPGRLTVQNCKAQSSGSNSLGRGVVAGNTAQFYISNIVFGAVVSSAMHIHADNGDVYISGNYSITGNAFVHYEAVNQGQIRVGPSITVTLTGTPAFTAFAYAHDQGLIWSQLNTYSGSATGARYLGDSLGLIDTGGGGASYFPGNSAGSAGSNGSVYV